MNHDPYADSVPQPLPPYSTAEAQQTAAADVIACVIAAQPVIKSDSPFVALAIREGIRPGDLFAMVVPESMRNEPEYGPWLADGKRPAWLTTSRFVIAPLILRGAPASFVGEVFHENDDVPHGTRGTSFPLSRFIKQS